MTAMNDVLQQLSNRIELQRPHTARLKRFTVKSSVAHKKLRTTHLAGYVLLHSSGFGVFFHPLADTGDGKRNVDWMG
jgi:hypothetical protein